MPDTSKNFSQLIGHTFESPDLLELALTHPSCNLPSGNNQRLEFLGDAVLDLIIAERLFTEYPEANEGTLDSMRASIVNGRSLAAAARKLSMDRHLKVSDAQRQHHAEPSDAMLEDAFESLIGALYLDGGPQAARDFVERALNEAFARATASPESGNPKGELQEWAQQISDGKEVPEYVELSREGPDHARVYTAAVHFNKQELGTGSGSSKKVAETAAARAALKKLKI